jgi:hypothetical protein
MSKQRKQFLSQPARGCPIWRDIDFVSADVGVRHDRYLYNGYRYVTWGEERIARMLDSQGVAFTPDVQIVMHRFDVTDGNRQTRQRVIFVPDFIFNRDTYIWTDSEGIGSEIHGIEAKAAVRHPDKVKLLFLRRNIRILVLGNEEIASYEKKGGIPLRLLRCASRRR